MRYVIVTLFLFASSCGPIHMDASITWGGGIKSSKQLDIKEDTGEPMPAIMPPTNVRRQALLRQLL